MGTKQKLLHISFSGVGGLSAVALAIAEADLDSKYEHGVIFWGIESSTDNIEKAKAIPQIRFIKGLRKKQGLDIQGWIRLLKAIRSFHPYAIICHMPTLALPLFIYKLVYRIRILMVEHHAIQLRSKYSFWISKFSLFFVNAVVCLTVEYRNALLKKMPILFGSHRDKVVVIDNAINENKYVPRERRLTIPIQLLMIGRFTQGKDHKTLIKAIKESGNRGQKFQLHLAGDGDTLNEMRHLTESLDLEEDIIFHGMLDEEQLIKLLDKTHIYVQSSLGETRSIALIQAMACKIPIIGSDVAGINNLLEPHKLGLLFNVGDVEHFLEQLTCLIKNESLRNQLATDAFDYFQKNNTYKVYFGQYDKLLVGDVISANTITTST